MERVRHGPNISTDTASYPNIFDDTTTSTSEPKVKRLHPTDPTQVTTSTKSPATKSATVMVSPNVF